MSESASPNASSAPPRVSATKRRPLSSASIVVAPSPARRACAVPSPAAVSVVTELCARSSTATVLPW
ncbi:Uncharacterised protein [Mycobacteroides abscessus subsp. abscessus]|nr:Uncharacterised protein [Mycobacteroides abscessus subsp. abscessus]